jgi:hypothetical protein
MKCAIAIIASSICAVDAGLSTMRVGPRKLTRGEVGIEFGRVVSLRDLDAAYVNNNRFVSKGFQSAPTNLQLMYLPNWGVSVVFWQFAGGDRCPHEISPGCFLWDGFKRFLFVHWNVVSVL